MIYIVKEGDSVDSIAVQTGVSVNDIVFDNQIEAPYRLAVGQALYIRDYMNSPERSAYINGYAYTFINEEVLEETLRYLTTLSIFSYGFTTEGELIPPALDDVPIINLADNYNVRSILTLTPLGADGKFNNQLIHELVNSSAARYTLISQLISILGEKGYSGVDIDFEYIMAEDRDLFTDFVSQLTSELNVYGYQVSVALAPKTSADQPGLLYQGKDYGGLGAAANSVLLMTYEWGYRYSEPMAVAPINKVRQVVEYAITEIPLEKIDLGIPNYGYDWPLPYEKGVTAATTIGNIEAVNIAIKYGARINFDETAKSPFFNYTDENGTEHEVWFEDVRSMKAKFDLIKEYSLRGAGYWQLMRFFRANWLLLSEEFYVNKI